DADRRDLPMTTTEQTLALRELVAPGTVGMLVSATPGGELHSRPLTLAEVGDHGSLWFIVDDRADWVGGLAAGGTVNFAVADGSDGDWVSIAGSGELRDDAAKLDRLWSPFASAYFEEGEESEHARLLEVKPHSAEYWDAPSSRVARLANAALGLVGKRPPMGDSGTLELD
ncbi:MAG: pyridoxamine 5'-phosphate oxidase family protein, partial [Acidimicrobiales bacterium]|nr:pyridoxamine 5'-phosphate oxidase family protein [Acidimicrobiales bacterium]